MHRPLSVLLLLTACNGSALDSGSSYGDEDTQSNGFIFKGPMASGSTITIQPLDEALEPMGEPVVVSVEDASGAFSAELPFRGAVRISATGAAFDEAYGEETDEELTLTALAVMESEQVDLNVNLLTDLSASRVVMLVEEGLPLSEALFHAEQETMAAIPIGLGELPPLGDMFGTDLGPYGDSFNEAWLLAFSTVIARAGRDVTDNGDGSLNQLLDDLRDSLAATGTASPLLTDVLFTAESLVDPELAVLTLEQRLEQDGAPVGLSNIHLALDSDHDGVINQDDNCRYVANTDQASTSGLPFGDACDYRLSDISTSEGVGCGILAASGELSCWDVLAPPVGGVPPIPDLFPSAPFELEPLELTGSYVDVSVAVGTICAVQDDGGLACSFAEQPASVLPGAFERVEASSEQACALDIDGGLTCIDASGAVVIAAAGPFVDLAPLGAEAVCGLSETDGTLSCFDSGGAFTPGGLPGGSFVAIGGTDEAEAACAVSEIDGTLSCFGADALPGVPSDGGFIAVALSADRACATDGGGLQSCWQDETVCPVSETPPSNPVDLGIGGCYTCGIGEDGLGECWPRLIDVGG